MKNYIHFTFILLSAILYSCNKPTIQRNETKGNSIKLENGRLVFNNSKSMEESLDLLKNKDSVTLNNWELRLGFKSIRSLSKNEALEDLQLPIFFATILNSNSEYQIGDTIVWVKNGYKYIIPDKDELFLAKIKEDSSLCKLKYICGLVPVQSINSSKTVALENQLKSSSFRSDKIIAANLAAGQVDARYQKEFHLDNSHRLIRKIVFEIKNFVNQNPDGSMICTLVTLIKQEWKSKSFWGGIKWRPAGERMEKSVQNLSYRITYSNIFNGGVSQISGTLSGKTQTDSNNLEYIIGSVIASSATIGAYLSGDYHAKVVVDNNSNGFYDMHCNWN